MTQHIKKLMKLAVFMAGLLAAVPQTAQAEFAPYATMGNALNSLDPHWVLTGSLAVGSLATYITLNNMSKRPCGCHAGRDKNCFREAVDWVANYAQHVASNTFRLATIGVCYKAFSLVEKGAMTTADLLQKVTGPIQPATQVQGAVNATGMPNAAKLGLITAGAAAVTAGTVLLYKKYKAYRAAQGGYAGERDE
jgi:hypothetical protein